MSNCPKLTQKHFLAFWSSDSDLDFILLVLKIWALYLKIFKGRPKSGKPDKSCCQLHSPKLPKLTNKITGKNWQELGDTPLPPNLLFPAQISNIPSSDQTTCIFDTQGFKNPDHMIHVIVTMIGVILTMTGVILTMTGVILPMTGVMPMTTITEALLVNKGHIGVIITVERHLLGEDSTTRKVTLIEVPLRPMTIKTHTNRTQNRTDTMTDTMI